MGLDLYYKENDEFILVTKGDDKTNPIVTTHDGKTGDTITTCLYIRNDDSLKWFSNIRIRPVDLEDANPYGDVVYSETGWGVKLNAGANEPSQGEWEDINWGNTISMANIGSDLGADIAKYYPFWYLITCPPNTDAKIKTDIVLEVLSTENAV
jgi:hypothetical protein